MLSPERVKSNFFFYATRQRSVKRKLVRCDGGKVRVAGEELKVGSEYTPRSHKYPHLRIAVGCCSL